MTPTNQRQRLMWITAVLVAVLALWPLLLLALHAVAPPLAVRLRLGAEVWLLRSGIGAAVLLLLGCLLLPVVPAGLRLGWHRLLVALRSDHRPLSRALGELQHLRTPARLFEVGRLAAAQGDARLAIEHLRQGLELEPDHLAGRYLLARMHYQLGQLDEARAQLQTVVAADPQHAFGDALLLLGWVLHRLGDDAGAAERLRLHQLQQGGNRRSHFWLARVLAAVGDRAGAAAALRIAAAPPERQRRLTAEENWYRARARVQLWRQRGSA